MFLFALHGLRTLGVANHFQPINACDRWLVSARWRRSHKTYNSTHARARDSEIEMEREINEDHQKVGYSLEVLSIEQIRFQVLPRCRVSVNRMVPHPPMRLLNHTPQTHVYFDPFGGLILLLEKQIYAVLGLLQSGIVVTALCDAEQWPV